MGFKHKCAYCNKEYETDTYYSKYCSVDCSKAAEEVRKQEYAKTKTKICPICGKEFQLWKLTNGNYTHAKYCKNCSNNLPKTETNIPIKTCIVCGKPFESTYSTGRVAYDRKYCSKACELKTIEDFKKDYEKQKTRICKTCGKEFQVPRIADGHFSETPYCSEECRFMGRSKAQLSVQNQREQTCLQKYGVVYPCLTKQCREANFSINSNVNKEFAELLKENGIHFEEEFVIDTFAYDFKVGDVLIELNPTYTHSVCGNHFDDRQYRPEYETYHKVKTDCAKQQGYHCINVWDWDNWNSVLNFVLPKTKLYARKLQLKEISKQEANQFLSNYHLQSKCNGNVINLGLYQNNELVQVMTFGKPRYNKNYQWELLRLCTKAGYYIVGGAERLFKYFIKTQNPDSVLSYCDMSKFTGDVYLRLGFKLKTENKPQKVWSKGTIRITDSLLRQRGYDQLFKTNYGKGTNNEQLMLDNNWRPIYDCGQSTYEWRNSINNI